MFSHFNLIGLATWRLSWVVLSTNYLRRCHCRWWTLVVQTTEQWSRCKKFPPACQPDEDYCERRRCLWPAVVHVQGVQLGGLFICLLCYRGCCPVASVTVLTVARARRDTVRLRVGRHSHAQSSSSLDVCSVGGAPSWGSCLPSLATWPNELNQWPIRTQCTIAWLPVTILLRFAHVIFIEINVDKIINAFTKNFL